MFERGDPVIRATRTCVFTGIYLGKVRTLDGTFMCVCQDPKSLTFFVSDEASLKHLSRTDYATIEG